MKRILILGISGSGKSSLALQLSMKLKVPAFHLDAYFWKPGWIQPEDLEWQEKLKSLGALDSWIIDGNYASSYSLLMPLADAIIVLNCSRIKSICRIFKRSFLHRNKKRADSAVGCSEKIDWQFLKYIWDFPRDREPLIDQGLKLYGSGKTVVKLESTKQILQYVRSL